MYNNRSSFQPPKLVPLNRLRKKERKEETTNIVSTKVIDKDDDCDADNAIIIVPGVGISSSRWHTWSINNRLDGSLIQHPSIILIISFPRSPTLLLLSLSLVI